MRPFSHSTGQDKACIIFSSLLLVLGIGNIVSAAVQARRSDGMIDKYHEIIAYVAPVHYGFASWILLNALIGMAAGITGIRGFYVALIVLTILGMLASIGGLIAGTIGVMALLEEEYNDGIISTSGPFIIAPSGLLSLSYGLIVMDATAFIFLLTLSIISCCVGCCGTPQYPHQGHHGVSAVVTTSASYPGYAPIGGQPQGYINPPGYTAGLGTLAYSNQSPDYKY